MSVCRCGHSIFRHYDSECGETCSACLCPEYRPVELTDAATRGHADADTDHQLRNLTG
jgi:hypothetical protein